jgi:hypothetical protein
MKKLLTALVITSILFGCKKSSTEEENYTLSGIVLDFDSNIAIAGAKVYVKEYGYMGAIVDSVVSDANGKFSFNIRKEGKYKYTFPAKANYLNPVNWIPYYADYNDRTTNLYLAKPSFVNLTIHKSGTYLPSDSVYIEVLNNYETGGVQNTTYGYLYRDKSNSPDKTFNLQAVYGHAVGSVIFGTIKLYFKTDIIRSGSIFSTKEDSTNLIQYGTQNFTLNY